MSELYKESKDLSSSDKIINPKTASSFYTFNFEQPTHRITINFDLDTKQIDQNLRNGGNNNPDYRIAYKAIGRFLKANGFSHGEQESTYISNKNTTHLDTANIISKLSNKFNYLNGAFKGCHLSSVDENSYEITDLIKNNEKIKILDPSKSKELKDNYDIKINNTIRKERVIRFDFDTLDLKKIGAESKAYKDAFNYFFKQNYEKQERSVYEIPENISTTHAIKDIMHFFEDYPQYKPALKSIQLCQIDKKNKLYDITEIANFGRELDNDHPKKSKDLDNISFKPNFSKEKLKQNTEEIGVECSVEQLDKFFENYANSKGFTKDDKGNYSKENSSENDIKELISDFISERPQFNGCIESVTINKENKSSEITDYTTQEELKRKSIKNELDEAKDARIDKSNEKDKDLNSDIDFSL